MFKACSQCGKIHPASYRCKSSRVYRGGEERKLRSSYTWTMKSKQIRERANHLCEVCRDQGVYTYTGLEVHHIDKLRENLDQKNSVGAGDSGLICLCVKHHKMADAGQLSKEYLRRLAEDRDRE